MKIPCFSRWSRIGWSIHVLVVGVLSVLQLDAADAKADSGAHPGSTSAFHKLRVEGTGVSQELQAKGARLIADYGSYQLLEAAQDIAKEYARHAKVSLRDEENVIELHARKLNTAPSPAQIGDELQGQEAASGPLCRAG
jgi:hypothetical protein